MTISSLTSRQSGKVKVSKKKTHTKKQHNLEESQAAKLLISAVRFLILITPSLCDTTPIRD